MVQKHRVVLLGCVGDIVNVAIRRVDIFPAVVVEVDKSDAPAGKLMAQRGHPAALRNVGKRFAVVVFKQTEDLTGQIVVDNIHAPIVIEVLRVGPHARHGLSLGVIRDPILHAALHKGSVSLVDKQKIRFRIVGNKNIHQSIAGVIGNGDSHALAKRLSKAAGFGDIFKPSMTKIPIQPGRNALI